MKQTYIHPTTRVINLSTEDCTMQVTSFGMDTNPDKKIEDEDDFDTRRQGTIWDSWND